MVYFENSTGASASSSPTWAGCCRLHRIRVERPDDGALRGRGDALHPRVALPRSFPASRSPRSTIVYATAASARCRAATASFTGRISRDHFVELVPGAPPTALPRRRQVDDVPRLRRPGGRPGAGDPRHAAHRRAPRTCAIGGGRASRPTPPGSPRWTPALAAESGLPRRARRCCGALRHRRRRVLAFCRDRAGRRRSPAPGTPARDPLPGPRTSMPARSPTSLLRRTSLAITGALSSAAHRRDGGDPGRRTRLVARAAAAAERDFRARLARDHGLTAASSPNATGPRHGVSHAHEPTRRA